MPASIAVATAISTRWLIHLEMVKSYTDILVPSRLGLNSSWWSKMEGNEAISEIFCRMPYRKWICWLPRLVRKVTSNRYFLHNCYIRTFCSLFVSYKEFLHVDHLKWFLIIQQWILYRVSAYFIFNESSNEAQQRYVVRTQWNAYEPMLIAEALFAVANVFSFARIIYLFQTNPYLGPLQVDIPRLFLMF